MDKVSKSQMVDSSGVNSIGSNKASSAEHLKGNLVVADVS